MTSDPFDRLRASNPAPYGSTAPPLERVLERVRAEEHPVGAAGRRSRAWSATLVPVLGIAAAITVAVVAVVALHHHSATTTTRRVPAARRTHTPVLPRGGMLGSVFVSGIAFPSPEHGLISLLQCQPCRAGGAGRGTRHADWMASTTDDGASWHVARRLWFPQQQDLIFSGADGWGEGVQAGAGAGGVVRFFVSHDAGQTWAVAPSSAPPPGFGGITIASGEVWSLGSGCGPSGCTDTVLHAPVSGSRFTATAAQPALDGGTNVDVVAAARGVAYVANSDARALIFATHDDGASWQRLTPPCPRGAFGRLAAGAPSSLWDTCEPRHGNTLVSRSTDGGRHWRRLPIPFEAVLGVQPASSLIAWALTSHGQVVRTTDGGRSWATVWSSPRSEPAGMVGISPILTTQSATSADVVVEATRGRVDGHARYTNLVVYQTSDGGATWQPSVVALPKR
jgi:photosystem II stability/assembly factor-like uncharacterized protein